MSENPFSWDAVPHFNVTLPYNYVGADRVPKIPKRYHASHRVVIYMFRLKEQIVKNPFPRQTLECVMRILVTQDHWIRTPTELEEKFSDLDHVVSTYVDSCYNAYEVFEKRTAILEREQQKWDTRSNKIEAMPPGPAKDKAMAELKKNPRPTTDRKFAGARQALKYHISKLCQYLELDETRTTLTSMIVAQHRYFTNIIAPHFEELLRTPSMTISYPSVIMSLHDFRNFTRFATPQSIRDVVALVVEKLIEYHPSMLNGPDAKNHQFRVVTRQALAVHREFQAVYKSPLSYREPVYYRVDNVMNRGDGGALHLDEKVAYHLVDHVRAYAMHRAMEGTLLPWLVWASKTRELKRAGGVVRGARTVPPSGEIAQQHNHLGRLCIDTLRRIVDCFYAIRD